jgi:hypothetical protein
MGPLLERQSLRDENRREICVKSKETVRGRNCASSHALAFAFVGVLLLGLAAPARAQKNSNFVTVNLQANATQSLSVTAAPALVNFNLLPAGGVSNGSVPVSVTTTWVLTTLIGTVKLYGYFASPVTALTDGAGDNIASSRVLGSVNGGAYSAFTGNSPFNAGSSLQLFNQFIFIFNTNSTRTDSLALQLNTTGVLLPAGTYSGLLVIQAQAL